MVSIPLNNGRWRSKNDPFNKMEEAKTLPDFIRSAKQSLANAEKDATSNKLASNSHDEKNLKPSTQSLRSAEQNQPRNTAASPFKNNVRGLKTRPQPNFKKKSAFRRFGPTASIATTLVFVCGALFMLAQGTLAPSLNAFFTQSTDLQFTSYSLRNTRIFKYMLKDSTDVKITHTFSMRYKNFSQYMQKRLKNNGIEVGHIDADGNFHAGQLIASSKNALRYNGEIIKPEDFQITYANNAGFREAYYKAKRGRVMGFFDDSAMRYYKQKGATRDILEDWTNDGTDEERTQRFEDTINERVTGVDATANTTSKHHNEETDQDEYLHNGDDVNTTKIDGDTPEVKARSMVNSLSSKVSNVGVPVCSALRIANLAGVIAAAEQTSRSIAYYLSMMESISKTLAGESDSSAINETLTFLTKQDYSEVEYVDVDGTTKTKTVYGSPLDAAGPKLMQTGIRPNTEDMEPYSINSIAKTARNVAFMTGATITTCDGIVAASAIVSLASLAIPGGPLAKVVVGAIAQTVGGIVLSGAVALIIEAIVPKLSKLFISNVFESYTGIPAGELLSSGAAANGDQQATKGSAYMPASIERVKTQNRNTVLAIAEEKELDRMGRSPFDTTSTNTFLGSILSKFAYIAYSDSLFNTISTFTSTVGSSINHLLPSTYAEDEINMFTSAYTECDDLEGTACDIYGNNIVASDYSTIDISPDDPAYIAAVEPNLEYTEPSKGSYNKVSDGGQKVKEDSELAKFINFCVNRESPWGVTDANILNALSTDGGIVINNLPILNDVLDVVNFAENIAYQDWATGKNCINSEDNPRWDTEFKYYQRYVEDMRIIGGMEEASGGANPVLAYEQSYEESHPVDTSFEGTLARLTGYTKNDIAFIIEFVNYSNELAQYDPSTRISFGGEEQTNQEYHIENHKDNNLYAIIPLTTNTFKDRRNYLV